MGNTTYTIREAKKALLDMFKTYFAKDENGNYLIPEKDRIPPLLYGCPGIGKTDIMKQIADEMNIGFVSYSLAHIIRSTLTGLPIIREMEDGSKYTEFTMSEVFAACMELYNEGFKEGILSLDEFNCRSETIDAAMLSLLQQKTLGKYKLPEGWIIVLAGNPPEYNKSARKQDTVTLDRVRIMNIEPDTDSFLDYSKEIGIHEDVIGFLETHKKELYCFDAEHPENITTPRGWTNLSFTLKANDMLGIESDFRTVRQFIKSERIAKAFFEYMEKTDVLPSKAELESVFRNGRSGAFDECVKRCLAVERERTRNYIANSICEYAINRAEELVQKYGLNKENAANGLDNMFELLKAIEIEKDNDSIGRYEQILADKIGDNNLLIKYVSYHDVPAYNRIAADNYNLATG